MKKGLSLFLFALSFLLTAPLAIYGQEHFSIVESDKNHVRLHFELGDFSIDTLRCDGELMHSVTVKGIVAPNEYGDPDLPTFNRFIAIPQGATAVVEVSTMRDECRTGINIAPSMGSRCENEADPPLWRNSSIYNTNACFPEGPVRVAEPQSLRGVDVIHLGMCPVQYNPVTKELFIHRQMDIDISFEGGNGHVGEDRLRSPYWDPILQNNILNYDCLPPVDYDARMQQWSLSRPTGCEYLIITPDNDAFYEAAQELADYRLRQGILTKVMRVTETGADNASSLRIWFREIYETWEIPPVAVCLIGESGDDLQSFVPGLLTPHPKDDFIISDNPFADVNDDHLPDICFTRLIAQDESELPLFIGKQIEYEYTQPVMDPYYYAHPLTAAGWENHKWFQITIATISGFLTQHQKFPVRVNAVYSGEPGTVWSTASNTIAVTSYFGPEGLGYIPSTPDQLGGWEGGTADEVIAAINAGAYLVQHRDHGWNAKWYQPEIYVSDFTAINNPRKMTYLISVNCRTGMYDASSTCFVEALIRMTRNGSNAGIVGAISPSGQTYSFANDIFLWGVWDLFDPSFLPEYGPYADHSDEWMPAFANVAGKYFLGTHVFPNADEEMFATTCNTFHTHGDAFLRVFTEVPQPIEVVHDPTISCFTPFHITATEGTQIALTAVIDGQVRILATATATGEEQELYILEPVTVSPVQLTLTGQNRLRHEENLWLVQLEKPFVVIDNLAMNGGGLTLHYDQTVNTSVVVANVGQTACSGGEVVLDSESEYVTITQGEAQYGSLQPNDTQFIEDAFCFHLGDNIPDGSVLPITITTYFGNESYSSGYSLRVLSPDITVESVHIDDGAGNGNGRLDPGEFATLTFRIVNSGHEIASLPRVSLRNNDDYVRVITPAQDIDDIDVGESVELSFDIYVEYLAGLVPQVDLTLRSRIKQLVIDRPIVCPVGFSVESFENGEFSSEFWTNDPDHPWRLDSGEVYDGVFSARSDTITHNESSSLTFTDDSPEAGMFSFYAKVSSETNYDFLIFSIDGDEIARWSGEMFWEEFSIEVSPGLHTYVWTYLKDYSVNDGRDAAWIDYIQLPFHPDETAEQTDLPLTLHPNPTDDLVRIDWEQEGDFTIQVLDESGRLVVSEQNANTISLAGLPTGLYHIVVLQDGHRWSRKIVKM